MIPKVHAQSHFHSAKDQRWKDTNKYFYDSERQFLITIFNNGLDSELNTVFHEIRRPGIREYGEGGREEKWRNYWTVSRNLVTRSVYLPPYIGHLGIPIIALADIHLAWLQSEMDSQSIGQQGLY